MPPITSGADADARSAAARTAGSTSRRGGPKPSEPAGVVAPRGEPGEAGSALTLFFESTAFPPVAERSWPAQVARVHDGAHGDAPMPTVTRKKVRDPRSPAVGLVTLVIFAFIATFFAWFSAGPLWLTLGHAHQGHATVADCPVAGIDKRCADFTADGNAFTAEVTLLGPAGEQASRGATIPAEMVSRSATMAYAGNESSLYFRWIPGLAIVLLCGFGIAWSTGSFRLSGRRARTITMLASIAGPILVAAGMLAITW
jgi:hypothetical protein